MTLLSICQNVADEIGATRPTAVYGSTDQTAKRLFQACKKECEFLVRRYAWSALRRDLLLAGQHTDTIYVYSLEDCVERGLLPRIAKIDWDTPARAALRQRLVLAGLRGALFAGLVTGRFGRAALAWGGWAVAIVLWLHGRRRRRSEISDRDEVS